MAEEEIKNNSKLTRVVKLYKLLMGTRRGRRAIYALAGVIAFVIVLIAYLIISSLPEEKIIPEEVIGVGDNRPRVIMLTPEVRLKRLAESALLNPPVPEREDEKDSDSKAVNNKEENAEGKPNYIDSEGHKIQAYPVKYNEKRSGMSVLLAKPHKNVTVSRPVLGTEVDLMGGHTNFVASGKEIDPDEVLKLVEPQAPQMPATGTILRVPSYLRMEENKKDPLASPVELKEVERKLLARDGDLIVPSVAADGKKPWSYYARPFDGDVNAPKIAIVITDLGMDETATEVAVKRLPLEVTLSFSPYADNLKKKMARARENGHEVMLNLPIEEIDSAIIDAGPYAVLASKTHKKNQRLINQMLSMTEGCIGFVGVGNLLGGDKEKMQKILKFIRSFGLLYVADNYGNTKEVVDSILGFPHAVMTVNLDGKHFRDSVDARLEYLTKQALANGEAVGVGSWSPLTMNAIYEWLPKLKENGIELAPVSYVVNE
ncbi:MAG: divergent polysaccharide deacetylase family protein [Alphaproteobacteria bacterium]|nr:divergent polysaccharide deacetylase family protein [Alphaproteobacteria bacterium]